MSIAVMPFCFSSRVAASLRRPGVDQGGLPFGRANQDRISLADVQEIDDQVARGVPAAPDQDWPSAGPVGMAASSPRRTRIRKGHRIFTA